MSDFIIEHQCPQCGAPAHLQESDRIYRCSFCRSGSYLMPAAHFHYCLPHRSPPDVQRINVPYWRLKGMLFSCLPQQMHHRLVDVSHQAVKAPDLPQSLGLRSQTQKLSFAVADGQALFLKPQISAAQIKTMFTAQVNTLLPQPILFQEFIGDTVSLVYAPFYIGAQVMDGVLNSPLTTARKAVVEELVNQANGSPPAPLFIPSLCPDCGWDLEGQTDAIALNCRNCRRMWYPDKTKLRQLNTAHVPGASQADLQMPFWRITAAVQGVNLKSYADLIRLANLPKAPQAIHEQQTFHFWAPAFKVRPQFYINLSSQLTVSQPDTDVSPGPPPGRTQTVNMPINEAVESLKLNLSGLIRPRERMLERLPLLSVKPLGAMLVYLPFAEGHHEFIHHGLNLAINKAMLEHARNL